MQIYMKNNIKQIGEYQRVFQIVLLIFIGSSETFFFSYMLSVYGVEAIKAIN